MELVTPDLGLAVWTTLAFLILLVLLRKFAWGPILGAVKDREESIEKALSAAEEAKKRNGCPSCFKRSFIERSS